MLSVRDGHLSRHTLRVLHVLVNLVEVQVLVDRCVVLVHDAHGLVVLGHRGDVAQLGSNRGQEVAGCCSLRVCSGACCDPNNRDIADRKSNRISTIIAVFCIIKSLPIGVCLGAYTGPVGRGLSRSVAMTRFGRCQAQPCPAALANPLLPSLTNSTYQLTR